jgi:hypothetical protein
LIVIGLSFLWPDRDRTNLVPTLKFRSGGYEISLITKVRNWQEAPKKNKSNIKQGVKYFFGVGTNPAISPPERVVGPGADSLREPSHHFTAPQECINDPYFRRVPHDDKEPW